ncbi:MarR family winged helix-turn-helix transcriptional regulator [Agathobacter sp.]
MGNEVSLFKNISAEYIFDIVEKTDFFLIRSIQEGIKNSVLEEGVYLSDLAEQMNVPVTQISVAVKKLESKGYVLWKLDDSRERTYIMLTDRALKLESDQKRKMMDAYEKIVSNIRKEDLETTMLTISKIRQLFESEKEPSNKTA